MKNIDLIIAIIFTFLNIFTVYISEKTNVNKFMLPFTKICFFIIFFHLGFIYKIYFEAFEEKIKSIYLLISLMIINSIILFFEKDINFASLYNLGGFHNALPFIPIITGITGIWFYLRICQILVGCLGENKIINYLSNNTKCICMHHIFCMYMLALIIYVFNHFLKLNGFDVENFKNSAGWYFYYFNNSTFSLIYAIVGICGSLSINFIELKIIRYIKNKIEGNKNLYVK